MGILIAILVFAFMIMIHEWGHYIMARKNGVTVNEFAFGMGPRILSHTSKKTGTIYSWRAFPIGGFCSMLGEDEAVQEEGSFSEKSVWARMAIVAGGPFMNILMAYLLSVVLIIMSGYYTTEVRGVSPTGGAAAAGMQEGDLITRIDGKRIHTYQDLSYIMMDIGERPIEVEVRRADGSVQTLTVTPSYSEEDNRYLLGITVGADNLGWKDAISAEGWGILPRLAGNTFGQAFWEMTGNIKLVIRGVVQLVTGQIGINNMMGPIGIVQVMDDTVTEAAAISFRAVILNIISLTALLSVNLGVMNLIPIPALDGSHLVFLAIEAIRGKPVNKKVESMIYLIGFILLIGLMIFVAGNDILRIFRG
ncbi:MAG: RIP metalloprotease RseP [Firmicutes bacterium]|nr:RIP metalloprotease RseP [Bacillota bacterium]